MDGEDGQLELELEEFDEEEIGEDGEGGGDDEGHGADGPGAEGRPEGEEDTGKDARQNGAVQGRQAGKENGVAAGKPPISKASQRYQELANRARQAEIERDKLQSELTAAREAREWREAERRRAEEAERQRQYELMTPEEQTHHRMRTLEERIAYNDRMREFERQDTADRRSFDAMIRQHPALAKYEEKVEQTLADLRSGKFGPPQNVAREALMNYIIGQEARNALTKQQQASKPSSPAVRAVKKAPVTRGDAGNGRGKSPKSTREQLFERLKDTPLGSGRR